MLGQLIDILDSIDRYMDDYPLFLYLVDTQYNLVWKNKYTEKKLMREEKSRSKKSYNLLWCYNEKQPDCTRISEIRERKVERTILKRTHPQTSEEIYLEFLSLPVYGENGRLQAVIRMGVDVTENEIEQAKLRNREKLFTSLIETSADAIFLCDNEDRIVSWNKGAEDIMGFQAHEIIGKSILTLIPRELIELGELYYIKKELDNQGFIRKYETQRLHKDGHLIYVDLSSSLIYDEDGRQVGTSEIIKDITSRKELEFELRRTILELSKLNELNEILYSTYEPEEIYRLLLVAITAGEGLRFNRAFLLSIDSQENMLKGYLAVGPSNEQEASQIWTRLQDQYRRLKDILQIYRIDLQGADRKVNEIIRKINIPMDRSDHILIRALVTRRVYQVNMGNVLGSKQYRVDVEDTDLFELLGIDTFVVVPLFTKKEPLGVIIADNRITRKDIAPEDVEGLKLFANQASLAIENARLYRNLEERISELQQAYQQLEENQEKLLRAERLAAIGEMSAKIAHEIRNPLVSIGGFARLMERKLTPDSGLEKYAQIIREQVVNLEYILNNILGVANPPVPHSKPLDIHQIIHQVLLILGTALEKRNISVQLNFQCFDGALMGDEKLLHQVLFNLVKNAMEALEGRESGGKISVATGCVNDSLHITVADNGPGIPPENLEKIFQPFFTTKSSGTGLGLSIVQQIVQEHKGSVQIQSEPGKGTQIIIKMPMHRLEKKEITGHD